MERKRIIRKNVINACNNLNEYQQRALTMEKSTKMAHSLTKMSIAKYRKIEVSLQDLLQVVAKQK